MRTDSFSSPPPECNDRGRSSALAQRPSTIVRVTHGAHEDFFPVVGKSVATVRRCLASVFSIPVEALPRVSGQVVGPDHILAAGEGLTFAKENGHKGVGTHVWTEMEFCKFFKITREDLDTWIGKGLKAKPCLDGSLRITETAADEFFRGSQVPSPYLTAEQAVEYLGLKSLKALYGLVERGKLMPLPGHRKYRFTTEQLDACLRGGGNGQNGNMRPAGRTTN
jgi:hypothetical protein